MTTPLPQPVREDLDYILREAIMQAATVLDELTLLRTALRRYADTGDAREAISWAAARMSNSLTSHP